MSADKERDTFHVNWIQGGDLTPLLTAQSYRPDVVMAVRTIKSFPWKALSSVCENRIGPGPHPRYTQNGHPCVKTQNVSGLIADADPAGWVDPAEAKRYQQYLVRLGDVLLNLTGAGSIGRAAVFLGTQQPLTNQHLARLVVKKVYDSAYVAAFLNTWWGQRSIEQGISGATGQLNLVNEHVRALPIPLPTQDAQMYIGNKVRQAEMLREHARALESKFVAAVGVDVQPHALKARVSRVLPAAIGADLNPGRYDPDRLAVRGALESSGGREIGTFARIQSPTAEPKSEAQTYIGLDGISSTSIELIVQTVKKAGVTGTSRALMPGPAISKLRPYLNKVAYVPDSLAGALGSTELLCVSPRGVHPAYVYGVLKLDTTVRQLNPVATGATHPRISSDDVLDIVVPMHPEHERLGRSLEEAQDCYSLARSLTAVARLLVEALVERKVTEAELAAAQHDADADRALVARLTAEGVDTPGARPLFEDVDRLLELVAAAQQPEAA